MQIIICGAGQVGSTIAGYLAGEKNDVTVVDRNPELLSRVSGLMDVRPVQGHASHPHVLEEAGAPGADMLIAVTQSDEVNMVICQVAHSLFHVPKKIARIRSQDYLQPLWKNLYTEENMPIDVIISPEIVMAQAVMRRLDVPGSTDVIPLAHDRIRLVGVRSSDICPLVRTPINQINAVFPDLNMGIIGIVREGKGFVPDGQDQFLPGDEVYFLVEKEQLDRALLAFGHEEQQVARRIVIFGGGEIGIFLAQQLESRHEKIEVKIIEQSRERAEELARHLDRTMVIHGSVLDSEILEEAVISSVETVVAVTDDDETNILSSLLAKRNGVDRTVTLVNNPAYDSLVRTLGVDAVINPRAITVSTILQQVRRGRIHSVHSLHEAFGELIEADALETSPLVGKPLSEIRLPPGVLIGAVLKKGEDVIIPNSSTIIEAGDRVVMFAAADRIKAVEKLFSVGLEYF